MQKTTVYLPADLKQRLARAAAAEGISEAELIRDAVRRRVEAGSRRRPRLPLVETGFGDPEASERVDKLLADLGFGG